MAGLSASIVAYKNDITVLSRAIYSFLAHSPDSVLYLIDNSPSDELRTLTYDPRIRYIHCKKNLGFGGGHNLALREVLDRSQYHLVLNPDIYFGENVINKLIGFMQENPRAGLVMPRVLYPDGRLQHLCKMLPTPRILLLRRFLGFLEDSVRKVNYRYEFQFTDYNTVMNVPFLSGCFMLLRTEALKKVGLFDERFFLYTEDADLTRRIHQCYETLYYPEATIYHHHARGSYKSFILMMHYIRSAIRYFNKWGWFDDRERRKFNQEAYVRHATNKSAAGDISGTFSISELN